MALYLARNWVPSLHVIIFQRNGAKRKMNGREALYAQRLWGWKVEWVVLPVAALAAVQAVEPRVARQSWCLRERNKQKPTIGCPKKEERRFKHPFGRDGGICMTNSIPPLVVC